jgi:PAS domain S-box-containing protein
MLSVDQETSDQILWEIDPYVVMTYISPLAQPLLGYAPAELLGCNMTRLLPERDHMSAQAGLHISVHNREGWQDTPVTVITRAGRPVKILSTARPHFGADGTLTGFTGTIRHPANRPTDPRALAATYRQLKDVLTHRDIHMVFQPIIDLRCGGVVGAEALSRFPRDPAIPPDRWFLDAANVGLGVELELLAVAEAVREAGSLPDDVYLSINVSPATLMTGNLGSVLAQGRWQHQRLVIEITEHVKVADYDAICDAVMPLRRAGARLAVDDAGAGFASFQHILRLQPDFIKLDRSFITGLDLDPGKRALVASVAGFAREINASIVAEGIESEADLLAAARMGLSFGQGYHIGRPRPLDAAWITTVGNTSIRENTDL